MITMMNLTSNGFSVVFRCPLIPGRFTMFQRSSRTMSVSTITGDNTNRKCIVASRVDFSSLAPEQQLKAFLSQQPQRSSIIHPIAGKKIRNLQDFVDRIPAAVRLRKNRKNEPGTIGDPVARLFRQTDLSPRDWQKYALFDKNKPYTRNLISTDHETYTLLLLCWNPGQESPIHDHPCDGCWLQVLEGGIREVRYDAKLNPVSRIDCGASELSYITDNLGYHKVGNPTSTPAVTLHLYAPPFERCRCWYSEGDDPSEPSSGKSTNHSEYGILKAA